MPNDDEIEDVLAWGPGEDRAVHHRGRAWDLTQRLVTGLAVAGVVVFVAIGGANHPPSPVDDILGAHRAAAVGPPTPSLTGPDLQPSCLVEWPDHRHVPCPWPVPKAVGGAKPDCFYPHRICPPPTPWRT